MVRKAKEDVLVNPKLQVTARVVDQFFRPPVNDGNSRELKELANSMSGIVPSLSRNEMATFELEKERQTVAGMEKQKELKKNFRQAVKDGDIPQGANPYFVLAYNELEVKDLAERWKVGFKDKYGENLAGLLEADDPNMLNQMIDDDLAEYWETNNLSGYDSKPILESFEPTISGARNELNQNFSNQRISHIETKGKQTFERAVLSTITNLENILDSNSENPIAEFQSVSGKELNSLVMQYSNSILPKDMNDIIVDTIIIKAEEELDPDLLKVIGKIEYATGNLADIPSYREKINKAKENILKNQMDAIELYDKQIAREEKQKNKTDKNKFYEWSDNYETTNGMLPSGSVMDKWFDENNINENIRKGLVDYNTNVGSYKNSDNKDALNQITNQIYQNPFDENLENKLDDLVELNLISYKTKDSLENTIETLTKGFESPYLTNSSFGKLLKEGQKFVRFDPKTGFTRTDEGGTDIAILNMESFTQTFTEAMTSFAVGLDEDEETKNLSTRKKKQLFNRELLAEYDRQTQIYGGKVNLSEGTASQRFLRASEEGKELRDRALELIANETKLTDQLAQLNSGTYEITSGEFSVDLEEDKRIIIEQLNLINDELNEINQRGAQ